MVLRLAGLGLIWLALAPSAAAQKGKNPGAERLFAGGEDAYYAGEYDRALLIFAGVAERKGLNNELRLEALRYVAFCQYVLGDREQAEQTWRRIMRLDSAYRLDPKNNPPELVAFFHGIQIVEPVSDAELTGIPGEQPAEDPPGAPAVAAAPPPDEVAVTDAPADDTARPCGVWLCLIPFGGGQFANDNFTKGTIFAAAEVLFLGLNITFYELNRSELARNAGQYTDPDRAASREVLQSVFLALYLVTTAAGILDAFLFP